MEYLFIYLLQITDNISSLLEFACPAAILSLISLIIIFCIREAIYASDYSDEKEKQCIDNIIEITKKNQYLYDCYFFNTSSNPHKTNPSFNGRHLFRQKGSKCGYNR